MTTASDLKRGMRVELDAEPYSVIEVSKQTPQGRGGATLIHTKLRNLRTKGFLQKTFKAMDRMKEPDFQYRAAQYLYNEGEDTYHFMDTETFEQFSMPKDTIEDALGYMLPDHTVRSLVFEGQCIGVEVEATVELEVAECDPGVRGDTVTRALKNATLETGLQLQVPLFIERGERIVVDTREGRYLRRA